MVHEDFHASNMLVRDGHLVGVFDWEISGVYPLSELLGVAVILQISGPRRYGNEEWAEQEEVEWKGYYLGERLSMWLDNGVGQGKTSRWSWVVGII